MQLVSVCMADEGKEKRAHQRRQHRVHSASHRTAQPELQFVSTPLGPRLTTPANANTCSSTFLQGQAELCSLTYRECYGQNPDEARCRTSICNLIFLFITNCTSSYQQTNCRQQNPHWEHDCNGANQNSATQCHRAQRAVAGVLTDGKPQRQSYVCWLAMNPVEAEHSASDIR